MTELDPIRRESLFVIYRFAGIGSRKLLSLRYLMKNKSYRLRAAAISFSRRIFKGGIPVMRSAMSFNECGKNAQLSV